MIKPAPSLGCVPDAGEDRTKEAEFQRRYRAVKKDVIAFRKTYADAKTGKTSWSTCCGGGSPVSDRVPTEGYAEKVYYAPTRRGASPRRL